jgi:hypothetical protein
MTTYSQHKGECLVRLNHIHKRSMKFRTRRLLYFIVAIKLIINTIAILANDLIIAQMIPGAWLVQIKDAGHGLMYQYPEKLSMVLRTFLTTTTPN